MLLYDHAVMWLKSVLYLTMQYLHKTVQWSWPFMSVRFWLPLAGFCLREIYPLIHYWSYNWCHWNPDLKKKDASMWSHWILLSYIRITSVSQYAWSILPADSKVISCVLLSLECLMQRLCWAPVMILLWRRHSMISDLIVCPRSLKHIHTIRSWCILQSEPNL